MNFYNPYYMNLYPYATQALAPTASKGLLSGLFNRVGGFNWSSLLGNAQKTLGVINQAIPVVKQVTPMFRNAKTMFQVMNEFKKVDIPEVETKTNTTDLQTSLNVKQEAEILSNVSNTGGPTFFV